MTRVKCYNSETGAVEIVAEISIPDAPHLVELQQGFLRIEFLTCQDHSTDHVYYLED